MLSCFKKFFKEEEKGRAIIELKKRKIRKIFHVDWEEKIIDGHEDCPQKTRNTLAWGRHV